MDNLFDNGNDLYTQSLLELADRFGNSQLEIEELPADWLETNFIIPTPRDQITGVDLPAGPIRLADHQRRIVNEALSKVNGRFKYSTVIYSAPKKSGKSALSSGVALYMGHKNPYGQIYCLANDGKQSSDRLYLPIWRCLNFHQQRGGILKNARVNQTEAFLPNYAHIEAIPCDAAGEAGSEPTGVFYCFDQETEILTKAGWKTYETLSMQDEIATLGNSGEFEWQSPLAVNIYKYRGVMHEYSTERMNIKVTPNHRMYGKFYKSDKVKYKVGWEKKPIEEALSYNFMGVRVSSSSWHGELPDFITIPGSKRKPELRVDSRWLIEFLGWYLSEGCTHKSEAVLIGQSEKINPDKRKEIIDLLRSGGFDPKFWSDNMNIVIYDVRLARYCESFGLAHEKYVPDWIKNLPIEYLELFLRTYQKGDGYKVTDTNWSISSNSSMMRDDLIEIGQKAGYFMSSWSYQDKRWGRPIFTVNFKEGKQGERFVQIKSSKWKEVDYEGYVFCPTVPNGVVYVRRGVSCYWQGQSELWGFTDEKKRRLFTEMTIPPTLYGKAIRWVESYAGYIGVSDLLYELYTLGVREGEPHPDFTDLVGRDGEPVVYVNHRAHMFVYWDTTARMIWQSEDYYRQEAQVLSPAEFSRIHQNQWVSPVGSYIQPEWWDACADTTIPELLIGSDVPCILGVDAALTGDCAAIVLITRHPLMPDTDIAIRYVKVFKASPQKPINIEEDIGREIRRLTKLYNIVCIAYDSYQMEGLAQNYRRGNVVLTNAEIEMFDGKSKEEMRQYLDQEQRAAQRWFYKFGQQAPRAVADKRLYDMVVSRRIHYNPNDVSSDINSRANDETLAKHIKQAGVKSTGNQMRIEKLSNDAKVDAAVSLSMAVDRCMIMALDNREFHVEDLLRQYQAGKITYDQYMNRIQERRLGAAFGNGG